MYSSVEEFITEMSKPELNQVKNFADAMLSPINLDFRRHFFDRVNDPRNGKPITKAELIGIFKRILKYRPKFEEFLKNYRHFIVTDKRTDINIAFEFVKAINSLRAKTMMRKKNWKDSDPILTLSHKELSKAVLQEIQLLERFEQASLKDVLGKTLTFVTGGEYRRYGGKVTKDNIKDAIKNAFYLYTYPGDYAYNYGEDRLLKNIWKKTVLKDVLRNLDKTLKKYFHIKNDEVHFKYKDQSDQFKHDFMLKTPQIPSHIKQEYIEYWEEYTGETLRESVLNEKQCDDDTELNKPFYDNETDKKFGVCVKDGDSVKKVGFGDEDMEIKRDDPEAKKNFRARHNCSDKKDKTKAGYWSCKMWSKKNVSDIVDWKEHTKTLINELKEGSSSGIFRKKTFVSHAEYSDIFKRVKRSSNFTEKVDKKTGIRYIVKNDNPNEAFAKYDPETDMLYADTSYRELLMQLQK